MKNMILPSIFLCVFTGSISFAQVPVAKKILFSIQSGEIIVSGESCLEMGYTSGQPYVVTKKNDNYFEYENGQRKGPFPSATFNPKACQGEYINDCAAFTNEEFDPYSEIISMEGDGMIISFKGKKYGPYSMVSQMQISSDKSKFVAVAINEEKQLLISSTGASFELPGESQFLNLSKSGNQFLVVCHETQRMNTELQNIDFTSLSEAQLIELAKKMGEQEENSGPSKSIIITSGGKKFGPFDDNLFYDNNPAFCITGGDNWYMVVDNTLYINGVKIKQFPYEQISLSTCSIWISSDGKRYAIADYDKIIFSDGTTGPAPLKMDIDLSNGKTVLKWISVVNEKDIVACSKEL